VSRRPVTLPAHAKLNLALAVGPPIARGPGAGFHPIASWMVPIDLADEVRIEPLPPGSTSRVEVRWQSGSPVEWPVESDLATRAHRALEAVAGPLPCVIRVTKSIPAGGGLGGGSSDAAAVLRGLAQAFELSPAPGALSALAHSLGSDIPFFIDEDRPPDHPPRPALVTGLGDAVERLDARTPDAPVLLICPPFGCPTGEVYRTFDAAPRPFRPEAVDRLARAPGLDPADLFNDLAEPAERVRPALAGLRRALTEGLGVPVHVSGSGSTLFCFDDRADLAASLAPGSIVRSARPTYVPIRPFGREGGYPRGDRA